MTLDSRKRRRNIHTLLDCNLLHLNQILFFSEKACEAVAEKTLLAIIQRDISHNNSILAHFVNKMSYKTWKESQSLGVRYL